MAMAHNPQIHKHLANVMEKTQHDFTILTSIDLAEKQKNKRTMAQRKKENKNQPL